MKRIRLVIASVIGAVQRVGIFVEDYFYYRNIKRYTVRSSFWYAKNRLLP